MILNKKNEFLKCACGLYIIYWKNGGSSVSSVGIDQKGNRWMAPANWVNVDKILIKNYQEEIASMEKVEVQDSFGHKY